MNISNPLLKATYATNINSKTNVRRSKKILLYAIGTTGDVFPMICFGRGLVKSGYDVSMFTLSKYQTRLEHEGIKWVSDFAPCMQTDEGFDPKYSEDIVNYGGTFKGMKILLEAFSPMVDHLFATVRNVVEGFDMVFLSGSSLLLSEILRYDGVKFGYVFLQPWMATGEFGCPFICPMYEPEKIPTKSNKNTWTTYLILSTALFLSVKEEEKRKLGLRTTCLPKWLTFLPDLIKSKNLSLKVIEEVPVFTAFSPSLIPEPKDLGKLKHEFTLQNGPFVLHHDQLGAPFTPPKGLVDFFSKGSKPIYFGYGSLQSVGNYKNEKQDFHMKAWMSCLDKLNLRGVLNVCLKHTSQEDLLQSLPEYMRAAVDSNRVYLLMHPIPHTWLFKYVDLVVHHGGAGTSQTACKMGVPSVVISHIADQPFLGSLLQHHGIAPAPIHIKEFTTEKLIDAVEEVMVKGNRAYHNRAMALTKLMSQENPIQDAVNLVDRYLL